MNRDANRPPLWVRFQLLGIPDRATALVLWWLLAAASIALPIYCLKFAHVYEHLRLAVAVLLGALCAASAVATGQAVRWMDRHGAWGSR